jgi:predicted ATP-grasp superfamily ATP-dependent carboligase
MVTMIKHKVIIWGGDDFNTLGLLRELSKPEIDLFFLIRGKRSYASKSKYCIKSHTALNLDEGLKFLLDTFSNEPYKPIIITSGDGVITYIDQHRELLEPYFILPGTSEAGLITRYIDKVTMTELAKKHGFLTPVSCSAKWDTDISMVKYPCIIKPSHEQAGYYNEFKFKICKKPKKLKRILGNVRKNSEFIIQQYVEKELDLLVYGARLKSGETIFAGAFIRDRWADSGSSSHGYLTDNIPAGANIEGIRSMLTEIDYYGPFSFEYGLVGDQTYFFEVNFRNDGTSHYFYQAGANIPLAYVYSCANEDYATIATTVRAGKQYFIDELFDVENILHRKLSISRYRQEKKEATIYKYYDAEDVAPWEQVRKHRIKQIIQDIILKKYRLYIVRVLEKFGLKK